MPKTAIVFGCYMGGSERPDFIGSHVVGGDEKDGAMKWRAEHCVYVGCGLWVEKTMGALVGACDKSGGTDWGCAVERMTDDERKAIRVVTLAEVEVSERWSAVCAMVSEHKPRFNCKSEDRRVKRNAYMRGYLKGYLSENPDKAEAKRKADRERMRERRKAAKAVKSEKS